MYMYVTEQVILLAKMHGCYKYLKEVKAYFLIIIPTVTHISTYMHACI